MLINVDITRSTGAKRVERLEGELVKAGWSCFITGGKLAKVVGANLQRDKTSINPSRSCLDRTVYGGFALVQVRPPKYNSILVLKAEMRWDCLLPLNSTS